MRPTQGQRWYSRVTLMVCFLKSEAAAAWPDSPASPRRGCVWVEGGTAARLNYKQAQSHSPPRSHPHQAQPQQRAQIGPQPRAARRPHERASLCALSTESRCCSGGTVTRAGPLPCPPTTRVGDVCVPETHGDGKGVHAVWGKEQGVGLLP